LKVRFIHEKHTSAAMPVTIESEHLPTEVGKNGELQSGQDPGEDYEHTDELS
jgi:hypothetical protein